MARAADDGYEHELLPGLRSSLDAARLADEIAFAAARLDELAGDPPGLYAEVARASDVEEGTWLAFLIAYLSPLEGDDPWASIAAARTTWASGELPMLEDIALGPRTAHDPARGASTLLAYRAWAQRAGSQAQAFTGDPAWPDQRRFDRAFERMSLPGFGARRATSCWSSSGASASHDVRRGRCTSPRTRSIPPSSPPSACSASATRCCCSAARPSSSRPSASPSRHSISG